MKQIFTNTRVITILLAIVSTAAILGGTIFIARSTGYFSPLEPVVINISDQVNKLPETFTIDSSAAAKIAFEALLPPEPKEAVPVPTAPEPKEAVPVPTAPEPKEKKEAVSKPTIKLNPDDIVNKVAQIVGENRITNQEWEALCKQESDFDPKLVMADGSTGIAQIMRCCVEDINAILGAKVYTLKDRFSPEKSREMFDIYTNYYAGNNSTFFNRLRIWNGGPHGMHKAQTKRYAQYVFRFME